MDGREDGFGETFDEDGGGFDADFEERRDADLDGGFDGDSGDSLDDDPVTDDGDGLPDEVRAELEAVALAEAEAGSAAEQALFEAQRALEAQRQATRAAVARYREALLASEPDLPPDLVAGETLEELDASVTAARETVARVRARIAANASNAPSSHGFPVGAPARGLPSTRALSSTEKIAAGLSARR